MAYLPHIDDPSVFCDSSVFSDINLTSAATSTNLVSTTEGNSSTEKTTSSASAFPILPPAHNFSALGNPIKFQAYINTQLPLAQAGSVGGLPPPLPQCPSSEKCPNKINSTFLRELLKKSYKQATTELVWVEKTVFEDKRLPVIFNEARVTADSNLWTTPAATTLCQPKATTEPLVQDWLNNIADSLAVAHGISVPSNMVDRSDRAFDSRTATLAAKGSYMNLKPDICLINRAEKHDGTKLVAERLHWRNIFAIIEITSSDSKKLSRLLKQIQQKAMCLFNVQPQRRYTCALALFGNSPNVMFTFVVVDRSGMLYTKPAGLSTYNAMFFLRIIFAFCFAKPQTLGWDPTMRLNPKTHEVIAIDVTGVFEGRENVTRTFEVVRLLHSSPILYGRGTRVWIVKDETGKFFVMKDSWILTGRILSEIEFIQHIGRLIQGEEDGYLFQHSCPTYCIGQENVWSTDIIRGKLPGSPTRVQRRIVTGPIGDPITSFRSKKEFVSVLLDIVNALEFLYKKGGIIHGDISMNNVMINRVWDYGSNNSPSQLRAIASTNVPVQNATAVNDNGNSTFQSIIQASAISASQALVINTPVVYAAATSATIIQAQAASESSPIIQVHDITSSLVTPSPVATPAATVSVVQVSATTAIGQAPTTIEPAHFVAVPTALTYRSPTNFTSMAVIQAPTISESVPDIQALAAGHGTMVDYTGTTEHIEASGMIIDGDFMRYEAQETNLTSGTLPFMSIQALLSGTSGRYKHCAGHDLESLLYTILTICHYTIGAGGQLRQAKTETKSIELNKWFTTADRRDLANAKTVTLQAFDTYIKDGLAPYWNDFGQFLQQLVNVTWDPKARTLLETPNIATHAAYRDILLRALMFYEKEETGAPAAYAVVPRGKRSCSQYFTFLPQSKRPRLDSPGGSFAEVILPRPTILRPLEEYQSSIEATTLD